MYEECLEEIKKIPNKTLIYNYRFLEQKWKFLAPEDENENPKFEPSEIICQAIEGIEVDLQEKLSRISGSLVDVEPPTPKATDICTVKESALLTEMRNLKLFYQNEHNYNQVHNSVESGSVAVSARCKENPIVAQVSHATVEGSGVLTAESTDSEPRPPISSRSTAAKNGVRAHRIKSQPQKMMPVNNLVASTSNPPRGADVDRKAEAVESKEPATLDEQIAKLEIAKSFKKFVIERGFRLPSFLHHVELGEDVKITRKSPKKSMKGVPITSRVNASAAAKKKPTKKGFIRVDFPNQKPEKQSPRFNAIL